ncbi:SusE domain-containing protein [Flavobacterium sp.]|uniref:SusE domain-containing protein n=1 Tax=Flavobacterium sp. TaxID=239 RepID=UPI00286DFDD3|nr:SusE domain-containing protein [Flavobacterium sp.]
MKTRIKIASIFALLFGFTACNVDDNNVVVQPSEKALIVSPEQGASLELNPLNPTNPALTIVWNHARYSLQTEVNYVIEVAKGGTEFAAPIVAGTTTARQITWSVEQLNGLADEIGLLPFTENDMDIRIKASLGASNTMESISDKITISITPYTTDLPQIAVAGNHQGWTPPTAPRLSASAFGETDFEGFLWLDGGYKFVVANATGAFEWGNTDYGDDGSFAGTLVATDEVDCNAPAGYYYVKANTGAVTAANPNGLKYSQEPASWGIIGAATPGGWDNSTSLTYNATSKKWTGVVVMTAGPYKFRANNAWALNLGADNNGDSSMDFGGPDLSVGAAGTYNVILDLSNPRAYTYSVTLQ